MLNLLSALLYFIANLTNKFTQKNSQATNYKRFIIVLALILHASLVWQNTLTPNGFILNINNSVVSVSFFLSLVLLISNIFYRIDLLDKAIYPLTGLILLFSFFFNSPSTNENIITFNLASHIILSMSAYAVLMLCFFQSIVISLQDRQLREKMNYSLTKHLPPLQTMEYILLVGLIFGVVLLGLSLISGFIFLEDIFAQQLVHKTVLSIIAWLIFISIIAVQSALGLRGKQLRTMTQTAFVLLFIAYFGSKFVLEQLLN